MNIKIHASLVLSICTVAGLTLGGLLIDRYWKIEASIREVEPTSRTMGDVERLTESVGQWLILNDLVLHKDETNMVSPSQRQARSLRLLVAAIAESALAADQRGRTEQLRRQVDQIAELIQQASYQTGTDRELRIAAIAAQADARAEALLRTVTDLAQTLQRRADYRHTDLADQRDLLTGLAVLAGFAYFVVVWLCWLWIVHRVVVPIEVLSATAGAADHEEREFVLPRTGPDEVKKLTDNISSFVSKLQDAKANTEEQVRQRTAELVEASKAKGAFIATMSHELRTPLNGIINMNELILDTELDPEQKAFATTAKNAAEALLALINDILDFSKIEARKLELETVEFDLRALVDGAIDILTGVAEQKRLELQAVIAPEVPALVAGDPTRLRQVLINLLNNALKFTSTGSVSVVVQLVEQSKLDATLRIEVRDTGIGIPEDRRSSLFRAFEQVDSSTTRKFGGTGLGLAICRELVGLMGGRIDVDSVLGVGSTFWFTVRLGKVRAATPEPVVPAAPAAPGIDGVLVLSRRPIVSDRVVAQLRFLGVAAPAIVAAEHVDGFQVPPKQRWLALVDPYRRGAEAREAIERVKALPGVAGDRVAVLDHWMRHWTLGMGPAPTGVVTLSDPSKLEQLRDWLRGELQATASLATGSEAVAAGDAGPPAEPTEASESTDGAHASATSSSAAAAKGRVLVVEDNPVNQRVVQSILQRNGYQVVIAEDGQQAVDAFRVQPFDLVLMDCQMPVMDGLEATRQIRSHEFERAAASSEPTRVPIVALTANAEEGFANKCFEAGMDRFLAKPCRKQPLLDTLAELLRDRQPHDGGAHAPVRVLVADDSPINQKVAQSVLGRAGYEVVIVDDGQRAVDALRQQPFAIVLMDCQMPVMDGLEATRRIRALEAEGGLCAGMPSHLPIIALTGNSAEGDRQAVLDAGMDRHVAKPFRPTELLAVVREFVDGAAVGGGGS